MNRNLIKPYLAEITGKPAKHRKYCYDFDTLKEKDIFPYLVLDGGAYLFAADHFGNASSAELLKATADGRVMALVTDRDGNLDWGLSYHTSEKAGMPQQHEWQSWPQRLYMLLPLAQQALRGEKEAASRWLEILRLWKDNSPYEELDYSTPHVRTSMKWRDMQVSWRSMTLIHSYAMLGHTDYLTKDEWAELYDFLTLNLNHLRREGTASLEARRSGNHVLQMGTALVCGGILFAELPDAFFWYTTGCEVLAMCREMQIFDDGMTKETGPSYSHFIARLYLEAQKTAADNGYAEIADLASAVPMMYQRLADIMPRSGVTLPLSDGYGMDAKADIENMAAVFPFEVEWKTGTRMTACSHHAMLESGAMECAVDAMEFQGGHQHYGRMQPLLSFNGQEILTDVGCCNYDQGTLYHWGMSADAHSVIFCPAFPDRRSKWTCDVTSFDAAKNAITGVVTVEYDGNSYVWTRKLVLNGDTLTVTDTVKASREFDFVGHWYLGPRETAYVDGSYRQALDNGIVTLSCSEKLAFDHSPATALDASVRYLPRLTWKKHSSGFTVRTVVSVCH